MRTEMPQITEGKWLPTSDSLGSNKRLATIVANAIPEGSYHDQWDADQMASDAQRVLGLTVPAADWFKEDGIAEPEIEERLIEEADKYMAEKAVRLGPDVMRMAEKSLLLQVLDQQWKEHLLRLDQLRQGISLRAYAQKDPLNEYKREAFGMFEQLLSGLRETTTMVLAHVEIRQPDEGGEAQTGAAPAEAAGNTTPSPAAKPSGKVARNAPCPCGSGKKYKHCHGKI